MSKIVQAFYMGILLHIIVIIPTRADGQLDALALKYATDKASNWHNYTPYYEKYFGPLKHLPLKFLEIGLSIGNSAHMWEEYFSNAQLHFMDNSKSSVHRYRSNAPERSQCHLVDQANAESLSQFLKKTGGNFDIILDDGGHTMDQQITSFVTLFPAVKPGGMYIIEDLFSSFLKDWGGNGTKEFPQAGPGTTIAFLQQLLEDINSFGVKPYGALCANYKKYKPEDLSYFQQHIDSMHCYNCLVIIFKR